MPESMSLSVRTNDNCLVQLFQCDPSCVRVSFLLKLDRLGDVLLILEQFRVSVLHHLHDVA